MFNRHPCYQLTLHRNIIWCPTSDSNREPCGLNAVHMPILVVRRIIFLNQKHGYIWFKKLVVSNGFEPLFHAYRARVLPLDEPTKILLGLDIYTRFRANNTYFNRSVSVRSSPKNGASCRYRTHLPRVQTECITFYAYEAYVLWNPRGESNTCLMVRSHRLYTVELRGHIFFGVASRPRTDFHKVHNLAAYLFASDHHINLVGDTGIEPAYRAAPNRTCLHDRSPEICAQSHQGLFNL